MTHPQRAWLASVLLMLCAEAAAADFEYRGYLQYEHLWYLTPPLTPVQVDRNDAVSFRFEGTWAINDRVSVGVQPFVRHDFVEPDRNAARLDELWVQYAQPNWDVRIGPQLATWGTLESLNRVDVFNARDYQQDVIDPPKIGTPAARLRLRRENSDLSMWYMPYFIPSHFPPQRAYYSISAGLPYTAAPSQWASQFALRWFRAGGGLDIGLSYVRGIEHTPIFSFDPESGGIVGTTYRSQRFGLEASKVIGDLILKGELVYVRPDSNDIPRTTYYSGGLEYTFSGVWRHSDLTLFGEYLGTRGGLEQFEPLQHEVFLGTRWTLNDESKQRVEAGLIRDFKHPQSYLFRTTYQRDLTDHLSMGVSYTNTFGFFYNPDQDVDGRGYVRIFLSLNF